METLQQHLLTLIDKLEIDEVFDLLRERSKETPALKKLEEDFIDGKADAEYYKRLKAYIKAVIGKDAPLKENSKADGGKLKKFLTYCFANDFFIGREDDMKTLCGYLQADKRVLLLNGLGGIGKTSLARQYAHQYQASYVHIVWLQQSGHLSNAFFDKDLLENLQISLPAIDASAYAEGISIVKHNHLPRREFLAFDSQEVAVDIFEKILTALAGLQGTNLLVVDNCEDVEKKDTQDVLDRVFALPAHWHILLTSREDVPQTKETLRLDVLPADKAVDLFIEHAKPKPCERSEVYALLEMVGFHTLMTELWAKTYKECFDFEGVGEFARFLLKNGITHQDIQEGIDIREQRTYLNTHLRDTFSVARLSAEEVWLLKQWAVLPTAPHKVKDFFLWIGDEARTYKEPLKNLLKKGWLQTKDNIAYYMHPALQLVLLEHLKPTLEDCKNLCRFFYDALPREKVEANPSAHEWLIPIGEALTEHIDFSDYPLGKALLLDKLFFVYYFLGNYSKALPHAVEAVRIRKKVQGEEHIDYLYSLYNLALLHCHLRNYAKALPLYLEAVEKQKRILGEEHENYLLSLNNLASLHKAMGDYAEALSLYQEAIEKRKRILGEEHEDYLSSLNNLAALYDDMGDYAEALPLYQEALAKQGKVLGKQHPYYATSLYNLGVWHYRQGRQAEALPYFEEAHKIWSDKRGKEHPNTKLAKEWLNKTKAALGKL
jgi:tetratricopeptide (TPR) repeat protein